MEIADRVTFVREILGHLVDNVRVTVTSPDGHPHIVSSNNIEEKAIVLAEYPELVIRAEAFYKHRVYARCRAIRFNDFDMVVKGQGKYLASELKLDLGYAMLGIS